LQGYAVLGQFSVRSVVAIGTSLALLQVSPDLAVFGPIERLSLVGALVVAVAVLWRSLARKDEEKSKMSDQMIEMAKTVTQAMVQNSDALRESIQAKRDLTEAVNDLREGLVRFPCVEPSWPRRELLPPHK
jgi:hypothetical protein